MRTNQPTKRTRRAEPITQHIAKNGTVSYWFQADVGVKADGSRDRRRFTYRTKAEARRELRRITSEVASGTYVRRNDMTVNEACDKWLAGRRGIRRVTLVGYTNDLKPVRRHLGGKKLQQLTKTDGDSLVEWMLTEGRRSPKHFQPHSLAGRVAAQIGEHTEGVSAADLAAAFPGEDVHTCLSGLLRAGRIARPRRAVYVLAAPAEAEIPTHGVKPVTVRSTLTAFQMVVQSHVDQGGLPRNVIALVERPSDISAETDEPTANTSSEPTAKSWNLTQVKTFREVVRDHRLYGCWLLSMYGLRRSEVMGLRWSDIAWDAEGGPVLRVRRGRVAVGSRSVADGPKSGRSRRDLPLPADAATALRALRMAQITEALALGISWSEDRLVAVRGDGEPVRHEWYSDEFHRLRELAGLRRIHLKGLRNTSVSLMLDQRQPVHIVAAWHGHDPAVSLSIYSDAKADELRAAGASLFD